MLGLKFIHVSKSGPDDITKTKTEYNKAVCMFMENTVFQYHEYVYK